MHSHDGNYATAVERELSSNLHEIRNRLHSIADNLQVQSNRLRRKNDQMIHAPGPEVAKNSLGSGAIAERQPLMSEVNTAVMRIEHELDALQAYISVTETI